MEEPLLKIRARPVNDTLKVLEIEGEIDLSVIPYLKERVHKMVDNGSHNFIVDLEQVRYIDSAGLGFFLGLMRNVKEQSGRLAMVASRPNLLRVFTISALDRVFPIYGTEQEAIASFSPQ